MTLLDQLRAAEELQKRYRKARGTDALSEAWDDFCDIADELPLAAIRERLEGLEIAICEALDTIGDKDYSDAEAFDRIRDKLLPMVRERIAQTEGRKAALSHGEPR